MYVCKLTAIIKIYDFEYDSFRNYSAKRRVFFRLLKKNYNETLSISTTTTAVILMTKKNSVNDGGGSTGDVYLKLHADYNDKTG